VKLGTALVDVTDMVAAIKADLATAEQKLQ